MLFPFEKIRPCQEDLIKETQKAVSSSSHLIAHAPTGIGKTAAALSPALDFAIDRKKVIFFLTSRHTQHHIAIETLKKIKEKHDTPIKAIDIIGKQSMCPIDNVEKIFSNEFMEYCKKAREDEKCQFFMNIKSKDKTKEKKGKKALSVKAQKVYDELIGLSPCDVEEIVRICKEEDLCPYEIAMLLAKDAQIIIADYYYIFHPHIREMFLKRLGKELDDCIVIVDEAHNLPKRTRDLMTHRMSNNILKRAVKEAKKFGYPTIMRSLIDIQEIMNELSSQLSLGQERLVEKKEFMDKVNEIKDYDELKDELEFAGDAIRIEQRQSSIASISTFLKEWKGDDEGYARIISTSKGKINDIVVTLSYRCLDPSLLTKDVILHTHSTIMMSGTLSPTEMYRDLLGFPNNTIEKEYPEPFPEENRLALVIPKTTTKYSQRNNEQYKKISMICAAIAEAVDGNTAIFFPSYAVKDSVARFFIKDAPKTVLDEYPRMTKSEKKKFIEKFKEYKKHGAVLLGVTSGSFGEGIDLPGDFLKAVIVVGLPLQPPDLETKQLIEYYDKKFGQGWDYAYVYPALTKAFQNAGRCIRNETDKGVIVFLDERYAYQRYLKCFPKGWNIEVGGDFIGMIEEFID